MIIIPRNLKPNWVPVTIEAPRGPQRVRLQLPIVSKSTTSSRSRIAGTMSAKHREEQRFSHLLV